MPTSPDSGHSWSESLKIQTREALEEAERMPQTRFIVLCGHTHSDSIWNKGNMTCHTAGSAYGRIDHSGMITLGKTVSVREIDRWYTHDEGQ